MIRYLITCAELKSAIQKLSPGWLSAARRAHSKFISEHQYSEFALDWSAIKSIYLELQFYKCAYCERSLETFSVEHDVEHFRPKSSVKPWPEKGSPEQTSYTFGTGYASLKGYFWLAYNPWNYATACKSCNSALKANYFPIAGHRGSVGQGIPGLRSEDAFLIYPIGYLDEDPEKLINFNGLVATPRFSVGARQRRAQVTIDFFRLNRRDKLIDERATEVALLGSELKQLESLPGDGRRRSFRRILRLCSSASPHAACKRAFLRSWYSDPRHAKLVLRECVQRVEDVAKREESARAAKEKARRERK